MKLDADGTPTADEVRITDSGDVVAPDFAWSGDGYGFAWVDRTSNTPQIHFARTDPSGSALTDPIVLSTPARESAKPFVHWTSGEFAVVWDEQSGSFSEGRIARIDADGGEVADRFFFTDTPWQSESSSAAWTGRGFAAVWRDFRDGDNALYFAVGAFTGCDAALACLDTEAPEICDGLDDDCDGVADEGCEPSP